MNAERRRRVEEIFIEASLVPGAERAEFVRSSCADDQELCAEVLSLLAHHDDESTFLDHAELLGAGKLEAEEPILPSGTRIAGFTIGAMIGTGGMGVVYIAEQERPHRTVALKVMGRALGTAGLLRRFEMEAEVLGRLQHPGIAQVYEAGTADVSHLAGGFKSQPYIAMELVNGPPLDDHARRQSLDLPRRLELMARVCDAVQHAHQRGVIHRDLKPANILVDASGQPKVLDFGVARSMESGPHVTVQTGVGQLIGTLAYMSPEQVLADPSGVDTRSDVYALGVILYQLLTGRLPHELDKHTLPEAARIIRDEEPARPGTWDRSLAGEVETIVAKALSKDRQRRYQSAADLGLDLRRFLDGKPIAAKGDSALYVLRKQLLRYRVIVAAAASVLFLLIAFAIYAQVQSTRNRRSALSESRAKTEALESLRAAKDARTHADETSERLRLELINSTVERGRLLALAGDLSAAEALLWPAFLRDPASRQTHWALWELYSREPSLATVRADEGSVAGLVLAPDEQTIYTVGADGVLRIWDRVGAHPVAQFPGSVRSAADLTLSKDGRLIAVASSDGEIHVWDVQSRQERWKATAHRDGARTAAFSPDGMRLASAGNDGLVKLWDAGTGTHLADLPIPAKGDIWRVVWSPDGAWLVLGAGAGDGRVMRWDGTAAAPVQLNVHAGGVQSLAISQAAGLIASGGGDRVIRLIDLATAEPRGVLPTPNAFVTSLAFTADGATLLSTGWWAMDLWDVKSCERRRSYSLRGPAVASAFARDGSFALAGLASGHVQFWDTAPSVGRVNLVGHEGRIAGAIRADGRIAATGDMNGVLRLWDAADGALLATVQAHNARIRSIRFGQDGRLLATGGEDGLCKLWDLQTGQMRGSIDHHVSLSDDSVSLSPDGKHLVLVRAGGVVEIHQTSDLMLERSLPAIRADVVGARFTPDGRRLAVVSRDFKIRLFPVEGGEPTIIETPTKTTAWSVCFSPDSGRMVAGDWARELEVWDIAPVRLQARLRGHRALPASVEFLPSDPAVVVCTSVDGVVRFWDTETHSSLASMEPFQGWDALSLSISGDGRRMLTTSARGDAIICDLTYFDRHIALNAESQIPQVLAEAGSEGMKVDQAREWIASVLAPGTPGAPVAPVASDDVSPDTIRRWAPRR